MGRNRHNYDSRSNPKQLTDEKQLPGKTISNFKSGIMDDIRIEFTDGTFMVLVLDYTSCYYEGDRPDLSICKEYRE